MIPECIIIVDSKIYYYVRVTIIFRLSLLYFISIHKQALPVQRGFIYDHSIN